MTKFDSAALIFFAVLTLVICVFGMYANTHHHNNIAASLAAMSIISLAMTAWSGRRI